MTVCLTISKLLCLCLVLVLSSTQGGPLARLLENYFSNDGSGNYEFWFKQSDNIYRWQKGELRYLADQPFIHVTGGFAYMNDDDQILRVTNFVADENGYQPEESEGPGGIPGRLGAGAVG
ncbi:endocuticle structural glycoprotein SgAbd-5-like isoform X1 [Plodia interpunctella]|uniref:endocuticle structural glycoprotein SgAbd-5-like isoform X1 n=1 Tax=Plodia interpunctella TaxID=58824 RepID=UPI002368F08B|nr:endocuticle structural glycoprotein SgAbd-5-like isoform X1 [Plodia interpunctella]